MNPNTVRGLLCSTLIGATMTAAILYTTPYAKADTNQDYLYYSMLENNGFTIASPQTMKHNAQKICADLQTRDWRMVATDFMTDTDYDLDTTSLVIVAATTAYCPTLNPLGEG